MTPAETENGMKHDEANLLLQIARKPQAEFVRDVIARIKIHHKRAWYILEKWCKRGWYAYGVSLDLGWLTDKGLLAARMLE